MIPVAVVRQREIATPWKPRKMMRSAPDLDNAQASVNAENNKHPTKKQIRRPMISAREPARRSVQPHVNLRS
jgi:hypothetical protein